MAGSKRTSFVKSTNTTSKRVKVVSNKTSIDKMLQNSNSSKRTLRSTTIPEASQQCDTNHKPPIEKGKSFFPVADKKQKGSNNKEGKTKKVSSTSTNKTNSCMVDENNENDSLIRPSLLKEIAETQHKLQQLVSQLPDQVLSDQSSKFCGKTMESLDLSKEKNCSRNDNKSKIYNCQQKQAQSPIQNDCTSIHVTPKHSQMENDLKNIAKMLYKLDKKSDALIAPANIALMAQQTKASPPGSESNNPEPVPLQAATTINYPVGNNLPAAPRIPLELSQTFFPHHGTVTSPLLDFEYLPTTNRYPIPLTGLMGNASSAVPTLVSNFPSHSHMFPAPYSLPLGDAQNIHGSGPQAFQIGFDQSSRSMYPDPSFMMFNDMASYLDQYRTYFPL